MWTVHETTPKSSLHALIETSPEASFDPRPWLMPEPPDVVELPLRIHPRCPSRCRS
jgi:hypothetical protein